MITHLYIYIYIRISFCNGCIKQINTNFTRRLTVLLSNTQEICIYIIYFFYLPTFYRRGASRVAGLNQILDKQFLHAPNQINLYALLQDLFTTPARSSSLFSNNPKFMTCRTVISFIFIHVLNNKTHFPLSSPSSMFF